MRHMTDSVIMLYLSIIILVCEIRWFDKMIRARFLLVPMYLFCSLHVFHVRSQSPEAELWIVMR